MLDQKQNGFSFQQSIGMNSNKVFDFGEMPNIWWFTNFPKHIIFINTVIFKKSLQTISRAIIDLFGNSNTI